MASRWPPFRLTVLRTLLSAVVGGLALPATADGLNCRDRAPWSEAHGHALTEGELRVCVRAPGIEIAANDASLESLLQEISSQTGLVVESGALPDERVTLRSDSLTLTEALALLLDDHDYILKVAGAGAVGPDRLWILPVSGSVHAREENRAAGPEPADGRPSGPRAAGAGPAQARVEKVVALAESPSTEAQTYIRQAALHDPDTIVRSHAVYALSGTDSAAAPATLERALEDEEYVVRSAAVEALGIVGTDEAAAVLGDAMSDESPRLRMAAVDALAAIASPAAIVVLEQAVGDDDPAIRNAAAEYVRMLSGGSP